jgi:hypothetical protein
VGLFRRGANVRDTEEVTGVDRDAAVGAVADDAAGDAGTDATDTAPAADAPAGTSVGPADDAPAGASVSSADDAPAGSSVGSSVGTVPAGTATPSGAARPGGPWDVSEVDGLGRRVDLGALWLPGVVGMQLRMESDAATKQVTAVTVSLGGSALQVRAFAAPRTDGIWDEIRGEIAESVTKQGGAVDEVPGPFGRELLARLPVRTPEGRTGHRPARIIGHDGPRWFLRGMLTGAAAVDPAQAETLEALFADIVVNRGTDARPPRDPLALRLPGQMRPGAAAAAAVPTPPAGARPAVPDFDPLTRGPEITEIR